MSVKKSDPGYFYRWTRGSSTMHADQTSIEISINKETNISKIIHILDNFTNKQDNNENQTRVIIHSQQIHIETENSGDIQCRLKELTNHAKSGIIQPNRTSGVTWFPRDLSSRATTLIWGYLSQVLCQASTFAWGSWCQQLGYNNYSITMILLSRNTCRAVNLSDCYI